jgi:hypothetical protein
LTKWKAVALATVIFGAYYAAVHGPLPFVASWWEIDEAEWNDTWHKRHRVADGLVLSGNLLGLTSEEIKAKLGKTSETSYFSEWDLVYYLGNERGLISLDSEWLVINLNDQEVAVDVALVRD